MENGVEKKFSFAKAGLTREAFSLEDLPQGWTVASEDASVCKPAD